MEVIGDYVNEACSLEIDERKELQAKGSFYYSELSYLLSLRNG